MKKVAVEFVGTFFLVLTIGYVAAREDPLGPVAVGAVLTALVYMGGHVSGAHYNPAVSTVFWLRGGLTASELVQYLASQLVAASCAALVVFATAGDFFAPRPSADAGTTAALSVEILFTLALVFVILNVAAAKGTAGNSFYGIAIGFVVMGGAFAVGPISGAAFNPAVGFGPTLIESLLEGGSLSDLWIYVVGPVSGGLLAAGLFKLQES